MCFAYRELKKDFYDNWADKYQAALKCSEESVRNTLVTEIVETVEKNLNLVGVSLLEDKLQEKVPETIRFLIEAGIRVYILTGDVYETAVAVARSCGFFQEKTVSLHLAFKDESAVFPQIRELLQEGTKLRKTGADILLVISGAALQHAAKTPCRRKLLKLLMLCRSVICYRMSPRGKADVVEMVQDNGRNVVLAIGDGANDIPMIQAANIGVGICGNEGLQAASASDYSIGRFYFLKRLLFIHGAWNFQRTAKACNTNICFFLTELWFTHFSAFSGRAFYDSLSLALFNALFSALEPFMIGILFKPFSDKELLEQPAKYRTLQRTTFTNAEFVKVICLSLLHSAALFCCSFFFLSNSVVWSNGRTGGWLMFGSSCYAVVCCDNNIAKSCNRVLFMGSYIRLFNSYYNDSVDVVPLVCKYAPLFGDICGMSGIVFTSPSFWFACVIIPVVVLSLKVLIAYHYTIVIFANFCKMQQFAKVLLKNNASLLSQLNDDDFVVQRYLADSDEEDDDDYDGQGSAAVYESVRSDVSTKTLSRLIY
ncbi:unnamed protein product [Enterobius vermicularis]|uniref:P-type phospholipid transporter n=1 Tax=Enterobius vermicularis TaxID=51028 RepID=A0A0N4UTE7_ENTVE|nr:unnamed protein product [Enterobius vermicularis]